MYYIGIDGGGTKTAFGLFDENGRCLKKVELSTCHFLQVGYEGCAKVLKQGVTQLQKDGDIQKENLAIGIGIAGYGADQNVRQKLDNAIAQELRGYHYVLTSDMHIALIGALNAQDGIVVVAGTGTIAMAQVKGEIMRCGGWGYQLGDEGSAYWIGKQLLQEFCWQADHRHLKDEVYTSVQDYFQLENPYQIISILNQFENKRTEIAKLALLCDELSQQGNRRCCDILQRAGEEVAQLVITLSNHFEGQPVVSYYGGVFQNNIFKEAFSDAVHHMQLIEPIHDALRGAYLYVSEHNKNG